MEKILNQTGEREDGDHGRERGRLNKKAHKFFKASRSRKLLGRVPDSTANSSELGERRLRVASGRASSGRKEYKLVVKKERMWLMSKAKLIMKADNQV